MILHKNKVAEAYYQQVSEKAINPICLGTTTELHQQLVINIQFRMHNSDRVWTMDHKYQYSWPRYTSNHKYRSIDLLNTQAPDLPDSST